MKVTLAVQLELDGPDTLTDAEADGLATELEYHLEQYPLVLTAQVVDWNEEKR